MILLTGCSSGIRNINYNIKAPYRVVTSSNVSNFGSFEALMLDKNTFKKDNLIFKIKEDNSGIESIEMPKMTKNTRENFGDNIINLENLRKWENEKDPKFGVYKDSLGNAGVYMEIINNIESIDFKIKGKEHTVEDDTVYYGGDECKVIRYKDYGNLGLSICKVLGGDVENIKELSKDKPVFITYYINNLGEIKYIGCEASLAMSDINFKKEGVQREYRHMTLEIYTE